MRLEIVDATSISLDDEDIRSIAVMEIHPEIRRWDTDYVHHSDDLEANVLGFRRFFERLHNEKDQLCLLARMDTKVVGFLGIHSFGQPKSHVADVGIMVHPDHQRKGIGTALLKAGIELARKEGIKRLEADTLATNKAMRRIAEKTGFRLEGIRRRDMNMHGRLMDSALYAILL